jgi:hypothetical protein
MPFALWTRINVTNNIVLFGARHALRTVDGTRHRRDACPALLMFSTAALGVRWRNVGVFGSFVGWARCMGGGEGVTQGRSMRGSCVRDPVLGSDW